MLNFLAQRQVQAPIADLQPQLGQVPIALRLATPQSVLAQPSLLLGQAAQQFQSTAANSALNLPLVVPVASESVQVALRAAPQPVPQEAPPPSSGEKIKSREIQTALKECIVRLQGVIDERQKVLDRSSPQVGAATDPVFQISDGLHTATDTPINSFASSSCQLVDSLRQLHQRIQDIKSKSASPIHNAQVPASVRLSPTVHPQSSLNQIMAPTQLIQGQNDLLRMAMMDPNQLSVPFQPMMPTQMISSPHQMAAQAPLPINQLGSKLIVPPAFAAGGVGPATITSINGQFLGSAKRVSKVSNQSSSDDPESSSLEDDQLAGGGKKLRLQMPHQKIIKKRVRNRYGHDTRYMGFVKKYVVNETTGRANQLFQCLYCHIKTPKLCNMIDHQRTHRRERLSNSCPNCQQFFACSEDMDAHMSQNYCATQSSRLNTGRGVAPDSAPKPRNEN